MISIICSSKTWIFSWIIILFMPLLIPLKVQMFWHSKMAREKETIVTREMRFILLTSTVKLQSDLELFKRKWIHSFDTRGKEDKFRKSLRKNLVYLEIQSSFFYWIVEIQRKNETNCCSWWNVPRRCWTIYGIGWGKCD